ncbi:MAG: tetratricopeptide repeat protein [Parachlamydia sp.]|nr:tetratricopeptide repeat protein [Parachlamydia sp.]
MYGDEHHDVAICFDSLGLACKDLKDPKKAIEYYAEALNRRPLSAVESDRPTDRLSIQPHCTSRSLCAKW